MKNITYVLLAFSNAEKLTDYCSEKDTELVRGSHGFIDSLSRENIACPSWYQSWQGYERCYPQKEFDWCWDVRPLCSKVKVRFTHFAVEEQSKFLQNWHDLSGDDVCIDSVQLAWDNSTRLFCDESHQNSREFTFSDNKEYDPNLLGWFSWVEIDAAEFAIKFSSRELGGSGTASFVGFGLQWECQDNIYNECLNEVHSCKATQKCVDLDNGYTCVEIKDAIHVILEEVPTNSLISERSLQMEEFGCATCHPKAECLNSKCVCMDGFKGTGYSCAPLGGRCKKAARNPCSKNAICEEQINSKTGKPISLKCTCKEGYTGSGKKCVKTSKICSDKCDQNAICINSECICNVGFNGDGRSCKKLTLDRTLGGLGFSITGGADNQILEGNCGFFITNIMKNGSAALDGRLRVGDMLVKIENESLINERHKKAVKLLQKAPKRVKLTVKRNHLSQRVVNN
ncbi:unnamed protein product [Oikopleura dioica]|uniref:EGF-like domain-containing protein n=1 Tax=Oikopleura dioica TaxID=34765 RepID=E4WPZ6_OIKDI|nr:unnamed protein product [Oikopleura dioica]